jgi:hypothetical protein
VIDLNSLDLDKFKRWIILVNKTETEDKGEPHMIENENGLASALGQLKQGWYEPKEAIAACFKSLIINHSFRNGNKRTAVINMIKLKEPLLDDNQVHELTFKLASSGGGHIETKEISNILYEVNYQEKKDQYSFNTLKIINKNAKPMNENLRLQRKVKSIEKWEGTDLPDPVKYARLIRKEYKELFEELAK